jgi:hypothetical protein
MASRRSSRQHLGLLSDVAILGKFVQLCFDTAAVASGIGRKRLQVLSCMAVTLPCGWVAALQVCDEVRERQAGFCPAGCAAVFRVRLELLPVRSAAYMLTSTVVDH